MGNDPYLALRNLRSEERQVRGATLPFAKWLERNKKRREDNQPTGRKVIYKTVGGEEKKTDSQNKIDQMTACVKEQGRKRQEGCSKRAGAATEENMTNFKAITRGIR